MPREEEKNERRPRFLVCDPTTNVAQVSSLDEPWVSSPIRCLGEAVDRKPLIIVVRFGTMAIREREGLVELCAELKRNSQTRKCRVLGLLSSKHRKLLEDLNRAGVDYVQYVEDVPLDSMQVREIIDGLREDDHLESPLASLCPFLHYSQIDSDRELTVCRAYLGRMVLGGRWLKEVCQTEEHLHCEYCLSPRQRS